MIKYVISHDGCVLAVATNRNDAEEYVLTCVEHYAYNDYLYNNFSINKLVSDFTYDCYETLWGYILCRYGQDFYIDEVEEI